MLRKQTGDFVLCDYGSTYFGEMDPEVCLKVLIFRGHEIENLRPVSIRLPFSLDRKKLVSFLFSSSNKFPYNCILLKGEFSRSSIRSARYSNVIGYH